MLGVCGGAPPRDPPQIWSLGRPRSPVPPAFVEFAAPVESARRVRPSSLHLVSSCRALSRVPVSSRDRRGPSPKPMLSHALAMLRFPCVQVMQLGSAHSLSLFQVAQLRKARRARVSPARPVAPEPPVDPRLRLPARRTV